MAHNGHSKFEVAFEREEELPRLVRAFSMPVSSGDLRHPGRGDGYCGLGGELADMAQGVIQTLLQVCPPHVLDPAREQFSGCAVHMPMASVGGMLAAMRALNWMSVRIGGFIDEGGFGGSEGPYDVGEMLQSVGDLLGGIAAQANIQLVIYHGDVGLKHVGVWGDEGGASYVLSHIVRQVVAIADPGDTIELGLHIEPNGDGLNCVFEISHPRVPSLDSPILKRLLGHMRATLQVKGGILLSIPATYSPPPIAHLTPAQEAERQPFPTLRLAPEPTLEDLVRFADTQLRGKRATFYASPKSSFARHLTSYLTAWGVGIEHRSDDDMSADAELVIIDDDVHVLRKRLRPDPPRKRPCLAHRPRSSPHIRQLIGIPETPPAAAPVIHFTSLANYKLVRDIVQSVSVPGEVLVIPGPAGPRRFLTALYTAMTRPMVDPIFAPIATTPTSPCSSRIQRPASVGAQRPSPLQVDSREYFSESANIVSPNPSDPGTGVVLQDLEGRPAGILFQPKPRVNGRSASTDVESPVSAGGSTRKSAPPSPSTPVLTRRDDPVAPLFVRTRSGGRVETEEKKVSRRPSEVKSPGTKKGKKAKDAGIVPPISVLIVEDNPINQTILSTFIRRKKIKCDVAQNGLQAVDKWKTGRFHLIFMDIQMPVMDGIEATREIRRLEKLQHVGSPTPPIESPGLVTDSKQLYTTPSSPFRSSVVIVALTASSLQSDRLAALAAGCNDFLTKPVALDWLDKKIIEWGSIKALQMWADPEMATGWQRGQDAKARAVATRLRIQRAPARAREHDGQEGHEGHEGGQLGIVVQAPTPDAADGAAAAAVDAGARRVGMGRSPLSRTMTLPGPPPPPPGQATQGQGAQPGNAS